MKCNRLFLIKPLREIVAFQNLFDRDVRGESNESVRTKLVHPFRIETHFGFFRIEQLEYLLLVSFRVGVDLFAGELWPRCRIAGRIANETGEIPNEKNNRVAQLL